MQTSDPPIPTWESAISFFKEHKQAHCEDTTAKTYKSHLDILSRWATSKGITLQGFSSRDMTAYLVHRKKAPSNRGKPVNDRVRHTDAVVAKLFFRFCKVQGLLAADPLKDQEVPAFSRRLTRKPTTDEVKRLVKASQDFYLPHRNPSVKFIPEARREELAIRTYAIILGLVTTAGRISELFSLMQEDYHPEQLYVVFRETKTDDDREAPIDDEWVGVVAKWLAIRPKAAGSKLLFVNEYGHPMSVTSFDRTFKKIAEFADMGWCTPHRLRGYAATVMAERSVPGAQKILGHKRVETTMLYVQTTREHARQVHAASGLLKNVMEEPEKPIMKNKRSDEQKRRRLMGQGK